MSTMWTNIATSRRHGQTREGMSERNPSAMGRTDGQKPHRRLGHRTSRHNMTKPPGAQARVKRGGCARKVHILIRGELLSRRPDTTTCGHGSRTEARRESPRIATEPYRYAPGSAYGGNRVRDRTAVSRRRGVSRIYSPGNQAALVRHCSRGAPDITPSDSAAGEV